MRVEAQSKEDFNASMMMMRMRMMRERSKSDAVDTHMSSTMLERAADLPSLSSKKGHSQIEILFSVCLCLCVQVNT